MNVKILHGPTEEDWLRVKRAAFVTIGKDTDIPPTLEWKQKMIRANHSPVRLLTFDVLLQDIPYWVSVHLVRHVHAQPFVSTQRNDRVKTDEPYDRTKAPQDTPVDMIWHFNIEELVTICHKRLCLLASAETRNTVRQIVDVICETYPEIPKDIFEPLCMYRGGRCDEFHPCDYCKSHGHGFVSSRTYEDILKILEDAYSGELYSAIGDDGMKKFVENAFRLSDGYGILYEYAKDYVDDMGWGE